MCKPYQLFATTLLCAVAFTSNLVYGKYFVFLPAYFLVCIHFSGKLCVCMCVFIFSGTRKMFARCFRALISPNRMCLFRFWCVFFFSFVIWRKIVRNVKVGWKEIYTSYMFAWSVFVRECIYTSRKEKKKRAHTHFIYFRFFFSRIFNAHYRFSYTHCIRNRARNRTHAHTQIPTIKSTMTTKKKTFFCYTFCVFSYVILYVFSPLVTA